MPASNTSQERKSSRPAAPILVSSAEVEIMRALRRQGRISRTEVSNITGWSTAKASQEIRSLVDKGYLVETGEGISQGGRKPRLLQINTIVDPDSKQVLVQKVEERGQVAPPRRASGRPSSGAQESKDSGGVEGAKR